MKYLKAIVVTCSILLFFSVLFSIFTILPLPGTISNVINREHFVKMVVKIDSKESGGGRSQGVSSYCIIGKKRLVVRDAEDDVETDNYYFVWYNTKTQKVYLTDKSSSCFDAYGRLFHRTMGALIFIGISLLLFFTIRFIDRRVK